MTIIPPGFSDISLELRHSSLARSSFLTFGVDQGGVDPTIIANSVLDAFIGTGNTFRAIMTTEVTIGPVTARVGQDGGDPLVGVSTTTPVLGTGSTAVLPSNCALLVRKRSGRGGRRGRGRWYIPWCLAEGDVSEVGQITPASITPLQTAMNDIRTRLITNDAPMVLLHSTGISVAGAPDEVTSLQVDGLISTQRRRLGR